MRKNYYAGKRIIDLNDREYANYRRVKTLRRNINRVCFRAVLVAVIVLICSICFRTFASKANDSSHADKCKYYTSVQLRYDESIIDIANKYFDEEYYSNVDSYLAEILSINNLSNEAAILGGASIYVPYYGDIH